jgi:hypothetical protein
MEKDKRIEEYRGYTIWQLHTGKSYYGHHRVSQLRRTIKAIKQDIDLFIYIKKTSKERDDVRNQEAN